MKVEAQSSKRKGSISQFFEDKAMTNHTKLATIIMEKKIKTT